METIASNGPNGRLSDDGTARATVWLTAWDLQGLHRTAAAGDQAGADWLMRESAGLGAAPAVEKFALDRLDPICARGVGPMVRIRFPPAKRPRTFGLPHRARRCRNSVALAGLDRWFESAFLQRRVRRTPTRTGEVPSDLEVVRYWDLAATERPKLNRTRRSAPSSAATRTVANPKEQGCDRIGRVTAVHTVAARQLLAATERGAERSQPCCNPFFRRCSASSGSKELLPAKPNRSAYCPRRLRPRPRLPGKARTRPGGIPS